MIRYPIIIKISIVKIATRGAATGLKKLGFQTDKQTKHKVRFIILKN